MAKRLLILTAVLVAVLVFLRETSLSGNAALAGGSTSAGKGDAAGATGEGDAPAKPTKQSARPTGPPVATHSPARLKDFYLPDVDVTGLSLGAALQKLHTAYDEACRECGEVAVRLNFEVPPDHDRHLAVTKLGRRTLDAAIRLLAAVSGLKVERKDANYVFTAPEETGEKKVRQFRVPPDFGVMKAGPGVDPFAEGAAPGKRLTPAEWFAAQGIELDPSSRLSFRAASFSLDLETTSAADELAVSSMLRMTAAEAPVQHKLETRVLELGADLNWSQPDLSQLDEVAMQRLFHDLTEQGAQLTTLPSVTARAGEPANVHLGREWIVPAGGSENAFETHQVGKILSIVPVPLGFGHHVEMKFTDTTGDFDPEAGGVRIDPRTEIQGCSFSPDAQARLHVQTRPDGTRTLLLVTPTLIDATGRPLHGGE